MYSDTAKRLWLRIGVAACAALIVLAVCLLGGRAFSEDVPKESAAAIEDAIRRSALQCYVVEGVYPPNLAYLEENYGLSINHRAFYVRYDAFASNIPPTVKVVPKHE